MQNSLNVCTLKHLPVCVNDAGGEYGKGDKASGILLPPPSHLWSETLAAGTSPVEKWGQAPRNLL